MLVISAITAVSPIIKALLDFVKKKESSTIKINSEDGNSIEFPSDVSNEPLDKYLGVLEKINVSNILITKVKK